MQTNENGNGDLVGQINIGSYEQSRADPKVVAVFRQWSECMKREGYDYSDPTTTPGRDPKFDTVTPTREEKAIAVADVACKQKTNLVGVWVAVDIADQEAAIAAHASELAQVRKDIARQLSNADAVLGTAAGSL